MTGVPARAWALALAVVLTLPGAANAAGRGGGGAGARGGGGGGTRSAAPVARAAPVSRPAPPAGGFNLQRDTAPVPQRPVAAPQRPVGVPQRPVAAPQRPATVPQRPNPAAGTRTIPTYRRPPNTAGFGPRTGHFSGPPIANPHHFSGTWGWNHGLAWRPAPTYWGGGFWGPWALGALAGAVLFGAIVDDSSQIEYPSYQVEPDSPGAQALQSYGLQQTPCGPPNLVVIWGPDNSVVCAVPNDTVEPGDYELDPATLNLIPASP